MLSCQLQPSSSKLSRPGTAPSQALRDTWMMLQLHLPLNMQLKQSGAWNPLRTRSTESRVLLIWDRAGQDQRWENTGPTSGPPEIHTSWVSHLTWLHPPANRASVAGRQAATLMHEPLCARRGPTRGCPRYKWAGRDQWGQMQCCWSFPLSAKTRHWHQLIWVVP